MENKDNPKLRFLPEEKEDRFEPKITILDAAEEMGVSINSPCGGKGKCGKCKVIVEEKNGNLSELKKEEKNLLSSDEINTNYRLACRTEIKSGNILVKVPEKSRERNQIILTKNKSVSYQRNPIVREYPLKIDKPSIEDATADFENIQNELIRTYDLNIRDIDYLLQQNLPKKLRETEKADKKYWEISAIVRGGKEIIGLVPPNDKEIYGLAIDIGTTTIVGYLMNMSSGKVVAIESLENPQIKFGEDLMSRITNVLKKKNGREKAQKIVIEGLNNIIKNVCKDANIQPDKIFEIVLVGNTAMQHLFLKIHPKHVSRSPYPPGRQASIDLKARQLELDINKTGYIHWLPINAGWVGADNVAVLLAAGIHKNSEAQMVIDIGTNGEIAIGNNEDAFVCSTAAGPALEGGQIKFGMRATTGSIEEVKIDPNSLEPNIKTIENSPSIGICGSGIIDAVSEMLQTGIIDESGKFNDSVIPESSLKENEKGLLEYILVPKRNTAIDSDITISQKDIREVQKAKGAMQAGARILMDKMSIEKLDKIFLAGAFGNYIDKDSALKIGLFPDCDLEKVESIGNAAGYGAQMALMSTEKREEAEEIPGIVKYFELASSEKFQEEFIDAMYFPHKDESLYS